MKQGKRILAIMLSAIMFASSVQTVSATEQQVSVDILEGEIAAGFLSEENITTVEENLRDAAGSITESTSTEEVSVEEVSTEEVSTEEVSTEEVSTEEVSTEEVSTEEVSVEEVSTEEVSTEEASTEEVSTEEASTEEISTEEVTEEVTTEENTEECSQYEEGKVVIENDNYCITFSVSASWEGAYNADVSIENTGTEVLENWYISFEMDNEITNIWNASVFRKEDATYIVKNASWNQDIEPGECVGFGFSAVGDYIDFPEVCELVGDLVEVSESVYSIQYDLDSDWGSGFVARISLANNGEEELVDWILEFDYDRQIDNIWNAKIVSQEDNHYVIKNVGYNSIVRGNQSVSFGFGGSDGNQQNVPYNTKLYAFGFCGEEEEIEENINLDEDYMAVQNALSELKIIYSGTDTKKSVTQNISLPQNIGEAEISWVSSNENIISSTGHVNRPTDDSVSVKMTATISAGDYTEKKDFELYVIKSKYVNMDYSQIEEIDELELLYLFNDYELDSLEVYLSDNGYVNYISGSYSDILVESVDEALLALEGIKDLLGMRSPADELKWIATERDDYGYSFRFQQIVNGIPVYGMNIVVATSVDGTTSSLYSSYIPYDEANTETNISSTEAIAIVENNGYISNGNIEKCYWSENGILHLSWNIYCEDGTNVVIDATTGEIKLENSSINTFGPLFNAHSIGVMENTGVDELGNNVIYPVIYDNLLTDEMMYTLRDPNRNISIYDMNGNINDSLLPGNLMRNANNQWTADEISAISNVIKTYNYFKNHFGREGFDDNNTLIKVTLNDGSVQNNSYCNAGNYLLNFGTSTGINGGYIFSGAAAIDTVAHEYTHGIVGHATSLGSFYINATGAINEGYADIFGYLVEGDNDNLWLHREDNTVGNSHGIRNMSNPAEFGQPSQIGDANYYDFETRGSSFDRGGVHVNNTIISHAAYLMWNNGISDKGKLADLWYRSLLLGYDGNSTFNTVRLNVLTSAKNMRMTAEEIQIIKDAFDSVGIYGRTKADIQGTNILTGMVVEADLDTTLGNNQPLKDVTVSLVRISNLELADFFDMSSVLAVTKTESDGTYYFSNIVPGTYLLIMSKEGYYTAKQIMVLNSTKLNNYCNTVELIPDTYSGVGGASGTIKDALTGNGVEGLTLNVREGLNTKSGRILTTIYSDANGGYTLSTLSTGYYCIQIVDERTLEEGEISYYTTYFNVKVLGGNVIANQDATVSTSLETDQLRIVLEWGATPRDLDSHLLGPTSTGETFHIYYSNKKYVENEVLIADLDLDDTTSYGPETTTLYNPVQGEYVFYVYNYSGSPAMSSSAACVKVYGDDVNEPIYVFNIPVEQSGRYWTVFKYNSVTHEITPVNTVGSSVNR